jgi:cytochrome c-type biogenesis protein CcmH/NrfF
VQFGRWAKRWVFPTIAILLTILAVIYLLDRRNTMPTGNEESVASPR